MSNGHKFKLPSGVEAEVTEMVGKHQKMLTRQDKTPLADKLNNVIKDVLIRVGSVTDKAEISKIVDSMLSCDKKMVLIEARQYSLDFPETFEFVYDYVNSDGKEDKFTLQLDLTQAFKVKPLEEQVEEYADVEKEVEIQLPRSGKKIQYVMMDSKADTKATKMKKDEISSHTPIELRNPREWIGTTWAKINLDNLSFRDIEYLREHIKKTEGQVDTEFRFEHPEASTKPEQEKYVVADLISSIAFFFPSGAI